MITLFSRPNTLLRLEGLALLVLGLAVYAKLGYSWPLFWVLLLLPDIAMLAYLFICLIRKWVRWPTILLTPSCYQPCWR